MENQTITVTDLNTIRSIIDLACSRGAFHGAEMSEVGQLFDKLTAFLDAVVAQAKAQEEAEQSLSQGESK